MKSPNTDKAVNAMQWVLENKPKEEWRESFLNRIKDFEQVILGIQGYLNAAKELSKSDY